MMRGQKPRVGMDWERPRIIRRPRSLAGKLLKIAIYCTENGKNWPSHEALSLQLGVDVAAISSSLNELFRMKCLWIVGNKVMEVRI